jgi:large subunit ribosomal protein L35
MPKLKSHKGASKRFKKTAGGKVKRGHSHLRHILTSKDKKRKRKLGKSTLVTHADAAKIKRMIPYQ